MNTLEDVEAARAYLKEKLKIPMFKRVFDCSNYEDYKNRRTMVQETYGFEVWDEFQKNMEIARYRLK